MVGAGGCRLEKLHRELVKRYGKEHFLKFPPKHTFKLGKLSSKQVSWGVWEE